MAVHDSIPSNYSSTARKILNGWYDEGNSTYRYVSENKPLPVSLVNTEFNLDGDVNVDVAAFKDVAGDRQDAYVYEDGEDVSGITPTYLGIGGYDDGNTSIKPIHVDSDGDVQTDVLSLPGGLMGYAEDSAHTTADIGLMGLAVRNDTASALAGTDGDYISFTTDALGNLRIVHTDVSGNAMPSMDAQGRPGFMTLTDGSNEVDVIGTINSIKSDTSSVAGTATNVNGGNRDAGTQTVTLADDDPAVTALEIIDDAILTEDAVHSSGDKGIMPLAVRNDTPGTPMAADGDYIPLTTNSAGFLYTQDVSVSGDDGDADPSGTLFLTQIGGVYEASENTVDDGDSAAWRMTDDGHGKVRCDGYDTGTDANKVFEVSPLSAHHVEETLADVTNGSDDTYYYYVDMDSYRKAGFQLELDGGSGNVTVTVEGTLQDDGTAAASCAYEDISNDTFGAANWTADEQLIDNTEKLACYKYIRLKVVAATGAADDADWTIYHKRLY